MTSRCSFQLPRNVCGRPTLLAHTLPCLCSSSGHLVAVVGFRVVQNYFLLFIVTSLIRCPFHWENTNPVTTIRDGIMTPPTHYDNAFLRVYTKQHMCNCSLKTKYKYYYRSTAMARIALRYHTASEGALIVSLPYGQQVLWIEGSVI